MIEVIQNHQELYQALLDDYRQYASCVRLVETGSFRRKRLVTPDDIEFTDERPPIATDRLQRRNQPSDATAAADRWRTFETGQQLTGDEYS